MRRWRYPFSLIGLSSFLLLLILSRVPSLQAAEILTVGVANANSLYVQKGTNVLIQFTTLMGTPPYTYTLVSGGSSLPPGTLFFGDGSITDPPTAEGTFPIVVRATDNAGNTSPDTPFVICVGIGILPASLPNITAGVAYAPPSPITTTCANGAVKYSLSNGPSNIVIDADTGVISGTTTQEGSFTIRVTATDLAGTGRSSFRDYPITSTLPPLIVTPATLPPATINTLYPTTTVLFSNRPIPLIVERLNGVGETFLPPGMTLVTANGQFTLSGTPTALGSYRVTVKVTDNNTKETTLSFPFTVSLPTLSFSPGSLPDGTVGVPYDQQITASGGTGPYVFDITVNPENSGLSLVPANGESASGTVSINGIPTIARSYSITVHVTDSSTPQREGTKVYTFEIKPSPAPSYSSVPPVEGTINFGIFSTIESDEDLKVFNNGSTTLTVSAPNGISIFNGPNAADFRFGGSVIPPFDVGANGADRTVSIICRPSNPSSPSIATMTFRTNDPVRQLVSYQLRCNTAPLTATPGVGTPTAISGTSAPSVLVLGRATGVVTQAPDTFATLTFVKGLALRSGPYLGATMLGVLRREKDYPVLAVNGGDGEGNFNWYLVVDVDNNRIGWASGRYLILKGDPSIPFAPTIFDQIDNTSDVGARLTIFGNVNMRVRPSERMPVVHTTAYGTELEILGRTQQAGVTQWLHVRFYDGATNRTVIGWVYYNFNAPELMKLTGIAPLDAVPLR